LALAFSSVLSIFRCYSFPLSKYIKERLWAKISAKKILNHSWKKEDDDFCDITIIIGL